MPPDLRCPVGWSGRSIPLADRSRWMVSAARHLEQQALLELFQYFGHLRIDGSTIRSNSLEYFPSTSANLRNHFFSRRREANGPRTAIGGNVSSSDPAKTLQAI